MCCTVLRELRVALNAKWTSDTITVKIRRYHCSTQFCQSLLLLIPSLLKQDAMIKIANVIIMLVAWKTPKCWQYFNLADERQGVLLNGGLWMIICPPSTILLDLKMWAWLRIGFCIVSFPQKQISTQRHLINSSASHNWRQILIFKIKGGAKYIWLGEPRQLIFRWEV